MGSNFIKTIRHDNKTYNRFVRYGSSYLRAKVYTHRWCKIKTNWLLNMCWTAIKWRRL